MDNIIIDEHTGMRKWSDKALAAAAAERERERERERETDREATRQCGVSVEDDRGRARVQPNSKPNYVREEAKDAGICLKVGLG